MVSVRCLAIDAGAERDHSNTMAITLDKLTCVEDSMVLGQSESGLERKGSELLRTVPLCPFGRRR